MPIGAFSLMGAGLVVALLFVVVLKPPHAGVMPPALVAVDIGVTITLAVLLAVLPKLEWPSMGRRPGREAPYLSWLLWTAVAGAAALAVDRLMVAACGHSLALAADFTREPLKPPAFMAATLAFLIAALCDIDIGFGRHRRLAEAAIAGAGMSAAIFLCLNLLQLPPATDVAPWFPFALSFGLGAVPGFIVPHRYRLAVRGRSEPEEAMLPTGREAPHGLPGAA